MSNVSALSFRHKILCEREIEKKNEMALTFLIVSVFDSKTKGRDEGEG